MRQKIYCSYERDYSNLLGALKVTVVITVILFAGIAFGDTLGEIGGVALGATPEDIQKHSLTTEYLHSPWFVYAAFVIGIFILSYMGLNWLDLHSEGCFRLPYKTDYYGNKIPKRFFIYKNRRFQEIARPKNY